MLLKLYAYFLNLYPEHYQKSYKADMLQTMEDILTHESRARSTLTLLREVVVTPVNALEQYAIDFSRSRHTTPKTTITLVALSLLAPFFISLVIDELAEFITGGHLYNTWLWSKPVLLVWMVILPLISLAISLSVYAVSLIRHIRTTRRYTPVAKRYWLTISTILLSAAILALVVFHDSSQCWHHQTQINTILNCTETTILSTDQH